MLKSTVHFLAQLLPVADIYRIREVRSSVITIDLITQYDTCFKVIN